MDLNDITYKINGAVFEVKLPALKGGGSACGSASRGGAQAGQEDFDSLYKLADETGRLIGGFMRYLAHSEHRGAKFK